MKPSILSTHRLSSLLSLAAAGALFHTSAYAELIGHWAFNEGDGITATDSSASGNDGIITGATWGSDSVRASYLIFNGTNNVVDPAVTLPVMTLENDFTWAVWANSQEAIGASQQNSIIVGNRRDATNAEFVPRQFINPLSPPSAPVQRRLQAPHAKSKFLAVARYVKSLTDPVKPHLHWSFDTPDPATATGTHSALGALKARFDGEPIVIPDGKFGSALRFNDSGTPLATKWQGVTGETPRTVAAWIRVPSGVSLDGTICMWGDPSDKAGLNRKWKLTLNRHANLGPYGALRLTTGSGYQIATSNLTDGKWHHVAVVLETGWPRLYVDGRRESGPREIPLPIDTAPDGLPLTIGGPHHTPNRTEAAFTGDIDEFWVFEAALSSTEIEILSRTNSL